jgi:hypothetical protein
MVDRKGYKSKVCALKGLFDIVDLEDEDLTLNSPQTLKLIIHLRSDPSAHLPAWALSYTRGLTTMNLPKYRHPHTMQNKLATTSQSTLAFRSKHHV